ncbi:hypothetical protein OS493_012126 [Desmophyllum pertusum]|uniref:DUF7869 domain-containing protein n=1 Tax=Desmophyllum pertusum TaxID=174260 RepID=A0A9X0A318_9CNID|nr:hypothetical protein OS493_012126 [Desmophyllum pertusum]
MSSEDADKVKESVKDYYGKILKSSDDLQTNACKLGDKRMTPEVKSALKLIHEEGRKKKYYKHGLKAKAEPDKHLSVTVDGMDQGKHNLPHFTTTTKGAAFIDCCQWPHDSNLTIDILLHILLWIQSTFGRLLPMIDISRWKTVGGKIKTNLSCVS